MIDICDSCVPVAKHITTNKEHEMERLMAHAPYLSFLSDSVGSGLGLQIILRVPVWVKDDYCVSRGQVYTQTTRTRW